MIGQDAFAQVEIPPAKGAINFKILAHVGGAFPANSFKISSTLSACSSTGF